MKSLVLQFIVFLVLTPLYAEETSTPPSVEIPAEAPVKATSAKQGYQMGLQFFQKKQYDQAQTAFTQSLRFDPLNTSSLVNLGLSALKNNQTGLAIGAWRRAIFVAPKLTKVHAGLENIYKNLPEAKPSHSLLLLGPLKSKVLDRISLQALWVLMFLTALPIALTLIRYFAKRKKAFDEDTQTPIFPVKSIFYTFIFIIAISLTGIKYYTTATSLATVIPLKQAIYTGPNTKTTTLFELSQGQEIIFNKKQNQWAFITYPDGLSGWIPLKSIFIHSGNQFTW